MMVILPNAAALAELREHEENKQKRQKRLVELSEGDWLGLGLSQKLNPR